jgi:hypothetical protein
MPLGFTLASAYFHTKKLRHFSVAALINRTLYTLQVKLRIGQESTGRERLSALPVVATARG